MKKQPILDGREKKPGSSRRQTGRKKGGEFKEEKEEKTSGTRKRAGWEECPYAYKFGVDTDEYEECDECEKWDDCIEAKENA